MDRRKGDDEGLRIRCLLPSEITHCHGFHRIDWRYIILHIVLKRIVQQCTTVHCIVLYYIFVLVIICIIFFFMAYLLITLFSHFILLLYTVKWGIIQDSYSLCLFSLCLLLLVTNIISSLNFLLLVWLGLAWLGLTWLGSGKTTILEPLSSEEIQVSAYKIYLE